MLRGRQETCRRWQEDRRHRAGCRPQSDAGGRCSGVETGRCVLQADAELSNGEDRTRNTRCFYARTVYSGRIPPLARLSRALFME